eukprot:5830455-Ditylum_brightwellii.AAC.1
MRIKNEDIVTQSKSSGPANPTKANSRIAKRRTLKSGASLTNFACEAHPRTRMILKPFKVPRFSVIVLINITMLLMVDGQSIRSAYVNEDSASDGR